MTETITLTPLDFAKITLVAAELEDIWLGLEMQGLISTEEYEYCIASWKHPLAETYQVYKAARIESQLGHKLAMKEMLIHAAKQYIAEYREEQNETN